MPPAPDLVNWTEHDVALPYSAEQQIFSGSVVVDYDNTSGFGYGPNGEPPVVAIYTANIPPLNGEPYDQEQALAYSHDGGMTWTFYDGNPVLDIPDPEFRDPKVFWQDNPGDDDYWVMGVARPLAREAEFYKSYDLKDWSFLSSFGPANAVGGIWEVPDLIEMTVENTGETKYLLVQNLNPGRHRRRIGGAVLHRRLGRSHVHRRQHQHGRTPGRRRLRGIRVRLRRLDGRGRRPSGQAPLPGPSASSRPSSGSTAQGSSTASSTRRAIRATSAPGGC